MRRGYVYILANRKNGALYVGVTSNIGARTVQHRSATGSAYCARYGIDKLMVVEPFDTILEAIAREKAIKKWRRAWKVELIEASNPDWCDRFYDLNG